MKTSLLSVWLAIALMTITSPAISAANHPETKLLIDYSFFDLLQTEFIEPVLKNYVIGRTLNQTVRKSGSSTLYSYDVNISDFTVLQFDVDWSQSHILAPGPNNGSIIQLRGLNLTLGMNVSLTADKIINIAGKCNFTIISLNADIGVGFALNPDGTNVYISLPSASIDYSSTSVSIDPTAGDVFADIMQWIFNHIPKSMLISTLNSVITGDLSNQIKDLTMNGTTLSYSIFNISLTIPEQPIVFTSPSQNYTTIGIQLNILNTQTGEQAPSFFEESLADAGGVDSEQLELLIASNLLNQIGWAVQQLNLINITISNKEIPQDAPISLNTTALKILLPELANTYGTNKGIYVQVLQADQAPQFYARDGRFIGLVSIKTAFWVDTNSSNYPEEGLANCTNCVEGLLMNLTLLLEANLFKINSTTLGATVLNVDIVDLNVIQGDGFNASTLKSSFNDLIGGLLPTVNYGLDAGIANPIIGLFGIKDVGVNVEKNALSVKISLKSSKSA